MTTVYLNVTSDGIAVPTGEVLDVLNGGTATNPTISSGAAIAVSGETYKTTVSGGGVEFVNFGGYADGSTVLSGGAQIVSSGGTSTSPAPLAGGFVVELPGSRIFSPDPAGGSFVDTGLVLYAPSSGVGIPGATATVGSGGIEYVLFEGVASAGTIESGGSALVFTGGLISDERVDSGAVDYMGGAEGAATVSGGGAEFILPGGVSDGATIETGGGIVVSSGGIASGSVLDGGMLIVLPGGSAPGPVMSGGSVISTGVALYQPGVGFVAEGNADIGATVDSGGTNYVLSGGTASGTTVLGGGYELVFSGGSSVSATVSSGGSEAVYAGGSGIGMTISAGGVAIISGGLAISATIATSGIVGVYAGGTADDSSVGFEAIEQVNAGGTTSGTMLGSAGDEEVLGGVTQAGTVGNGGYEYVFSGGAANAAVVQNNGLLVVFSGTTSANIVSSGGQEQVRSGTATSATVTGAEATLLVYPGGTASGTVVSSGGEQYVHGGVADFTVISSGGIEDTQYGSTESGAMVYNAGTEIVDYGGTELGVEMFSGGTAVLDAGDNAVGGLIFGGTETMLQIGGTTMPTAVISGFAKQMTIDLLNEGYSAGWVATGDSAEHVNITGIGNGGTETLQFDRNYAGATFLLTPDGGVGTDVVITQLPDYRDGPCFREGTLIRTARGEIAVEALRAGDLVASAFGGAVPVVWLGHRRVDCRRNPKPRDVWPVRVDAGAFGPGQPCRTLYLSPDHAVFVQSDAATGAPGDAAAGAPGDAAAGAPGVLIPVRYLINDATIVQEPVEAVTYWHVELPAHDVMFAEGLPAESYLDTGNRGAFENGAGPVMLHPDFARRVWEAESCATLVYSGAQLAAVRTRLLSRAAAAGHLLTDASELHLVIDGRTVFPEIIGRVHRFRLAGARTARLVSRSGVPAATQAASDDHRRLGVAVSRVMLDGSQLKLTDARLGAGWHAPDGHAGATPGWRWTDGDAQLDVAGAEVLEVLVAITAQSWWSDAPFARDHTAQF